MPYLTQKIFIALLFSSFTFSAHSAMNNETRDILRKSNRILKSPPRHIKAKRYNANTRYENGLERSLAIMTPDYQPSIESNLVEKSMSLEKKKTLIRLRPNTQVTTQ